MLLIWCDKLKKKILMHTFIFGKHSQQLIFIDQSFWHDWNNNYDLYDSL